MISEIERRYTRLAVTQDTPEQIAAIHSERARVALLTQRAEREQTVAGLFSERGRRYEQCTLADFDCDSPAKLSIVAALRRYCEEMPERFLAGDGLLFYGPTGTGKDHLMAAALRGAILAHGLRVRWENGMDLYGEVRDRIDGDRPEAAFVRKLVSPDVLAISDPIPPFGALTGFQASMLFRIVDARYSHCKPTWLTINVANFSEANERLGASLVDRILQGALILHCNWPSYRAGKP